eukprot:TRINITY_DN3701_c0_g1_i1.p1 TRINITY_DN3701_c0_g1~~TRINITY_DN3701_c0_g1_i1.p1  ORF type:complete len:137 (-),score=26.99 TRINITY_DN3701_c0_g1_i1:70-480(-)
MEPLKVELLESLDYLSDVKTWIQLNIPRIEDGNNFGVTVQEEVLAEVGRVEDASFTSLEILSKYFVTRAKLVSKCLKYPLISDYRRSTFDLDEKAYIDLQTTCRELRNNYAILYDTIQKNKEKIITPRTSNTSIMY